MFAEYNSTMSKIHTLRVAAIEKETTDSSTISLEIPENLSAAFAFKAGQYLTVILDLNGEEVRRSYSMSSAPMDKGLAFTVKTVPGGKASTHLNNKLSVGDELKVLAPEGRFVAKPDPEANKSYYLFAAGSGITPIMSIIRTLLEEEPLSTLHLLFANRDEENIIFKEQLENLAARHQGQLILDYVISQPKTKKSGGLGGWFKKPTISWSGKKGRISQGMVLDFLNENPIRDNEDDYFLCGPAGFMDTVKTALESKAISSKKIHTEFFTAADATPQAAATGASTEPVVSELTYTLEGAEQQLHLPLGKTILESLLDARIDAPFSCQSGACSTCMCKVESGAVMMDTCLALDEDEVAEGYVLACQSRPTTATVKISFDV